ncbi:phosphatidate cytidylyltransferase [Glutamicibacter mishrai]|nr:phosphatidate cytidylyltransferase [Glutamicibacter mishrai]
MPGSTENTEGNASAVPSVASGTAQPMTRREARALREAEEKARKRKGAPSQPADSAAPVMPEAPVAREQNQATTAHAKQRAKIVFEADKEQPSAAPESKPATDPVAADKPEPPHSDSEDLAETGEPDAQEAAIPPELLIGNPEPKKSRAGRNLPAAIGVGVVLLGVVLGGLFLYEPLLVFAVTVLSGIGCWEVARATTHAKTAVPQVPLYLASIMLPVSAVLGGVEALGFSFVACILVALLFRLMEGLKGAVASVMSSVFIISWIPLLLSFALLMLEGENGQWLIATILLLAVANDTFGYIVGVLIGKHPMAPKISPKKSWEGFGGSMLGSMIIGACAMVFWLDMPWWAGVILAFFTTIAATTGDFAESMVKRELGIKDMSNLLPGHGGIMDRLDSVLFVIPLGYLISHLLAWSVAVF